MSKQSIEELPQEESLEDDEIKSEGTKIIKRAEDRGDWGDWANLVAEMKTINPEMNLTIDRNTENAIKKSLETKKANAEKDRDWTAYASLASNAKRINPEIDIEDKEAEKKILEQLDDFEKNALSTGRWQDYVGLLSKMKLINKDTCPKPNDEIKKAIAADVLRSGSATDLDYAARARMVFPDLTASDLGVDGGVLNEANNNLSNYRDFYKNYDNYFKLMANMRILETPELKI